MYKLFSILTILIVLAFENAGRNSPISANMEGRVIRDQVEDRYARIGGASLYYLIKFTEWPKNTFLNDEFKVCLVGDDELNESIEETLRGKFAAQKPISSMRLKSGLEYKKCNVIFFGQSGGALSGSIIDAIVDLPILTVTTTKNLPAMILIGEKRNKLHLTVNLKVTDRAGLRLSSELLDLVSFVKS